MKITEKIYIKRLVLSILLGGIAGFAYYYFIGCKSGTCAIKSNPYYMTLWGMLVGGIAGFKKKVDKNNDK